MTERLNYVFAITPSFPRAIIVMYFNFMCAINTQNIVTIFALNKHVSFRAVKLN